jgi:hypothetical protein
LQGADDRARMLDALTVIESGDPMAPRVLFAPKPFIVPGPLASAWLNVAVSRRKHAEYGDPRTTRHCHGRVHRPWRK